MNLQQLGRFGFVINLLIVIILWAWQWYLGVAYLAFWTIIFIVIYKKYFTIEEEQQ